MGCIIVKRISGKAMPKENENHASWQNVFGRNSGKPLLCAWQCFLWPKDGRAVYQLKFYPRFFSVCPLLIVCCVLYTMCVETKNSMLESGAVRGARKTIHGSVATCFSVMDPWENGSSSQKEVPTSSASMLLVHGCDHQSHSQATHHLTRRDKHVVTWLKICYFPPVFNVTCH